MVLWPVLMCLPDRILSPERSNVLRHRGRKVHVPASCAVGSTPEQVSRRCHVHSISDVGLGHPKLTKRRATALMRDHARQLSCRTGAQCRGSRQDCGHSPAQLAKQTRSLVQSAASHSEAASPASEFARRMRPGNTAQLHESF